MWESAYVSFTFEAHIAVLTGFFCNVAYKFSHSLVEEYSCTETICYLLEIPISALNRGYFN